MKCLSCGIDFEKSYDTCPNCGAPMNRATTINPVKEWMLTLFKDKLFLVLCILLSVSCGAQLINGAFPLLEGLITAFLWVVFAQAKKDIASSKHLRVVSGVVFANYVIMYVLAGIVALLGGLMALVCSMASDNSDLMNELLSSIGTIDGIPNEAMKAFISASGGIMFVLFLVIAIVLVVINLLSMRPMHQLAKSVYQSIDQGVWDLKKVGAAKGWLWVFGVFAGLSALGSLTDGNVIAALAEGALAAAQIIAALLIGRYAIPVLPIPATVDEQPETPVLPAENSEM